MPMEYIIPNLQIVAMTGMADHEALEERLAQLEELEEERFLAGSISKYKNNTRKLGTITTSSCACSK